MTLQEATEFCSKGGARVFEPRILYQNENVSRRAKDALILESYWLGVIDISEEGRYIMMCFFYFYFYCTSTSSKRGHARIAGNEGEYRLVKKR